MKNTSKRRVPWFVPPKVAQRYSKAARLKRKGIRTDLTKAEASKLCAAVAQPHDGMQHWLTEIDREIREQHAAERARAIATAKQAR